MRCVGSGRLTAKNTVKINRIECHINSNFRLLLQHDEITETAKTILNGWIKSTETVAGSQALRKKIGHILFGFRVVYGDAIFVTVTPNRRNSALLLYLSRTGVNDTCFLSASSSAQYRRQHCGMDSPNFISEHSIHTDKDGQKVRLEIPMPSMSDRQMLAAQDPLATAHKLQIMMRVVLPNLFGLLMCFACPFCNIDDADLDVKPGTHQ